MPRRSLPGIIRATIDEVDDGQYYLNHSTVISYDFPRLFSYASYTWARFQFLYILMNVTTL